MSLAQRFLQECLLFQKSYDVKRWVVALSGGLDSSVVLHLAKHLLIKQDTQVVALHVNHQLQTQADHWQAFCAEQCRSLNIEFYPFSISADGKSEQKLRAARYQCFEAFLEEGDCLLFGHHANDQAETLLFRLLRGTGLKGVAAMPVSRAIAKGFLFRPLLSVDKRHLLEYAQQQVLDWVEDPSNQSTEYDRNYLRHQVFKPIAEHWPQGVEKMALATQLLASDYQLLEQYLAEDLEKLTQANAHGSSLDLDKWRQLEQSKAVAVLRSWIAKFILRPVTGKELSRCIDEVIHSRVDSSAYCPLGLFHLRRYKQQLFMVKEAELPLSWPSVKSEEQCLNMAHGSLNVSLTKRGVLLTADMYWAHDVGNLKLRLADRPRKSLKQIFQEQQIAPWLRKGWPVLMCEGKVVAVAGICISSDWLSESETKSLFCFQWQPL